MHPKKTSSQVPFRGALTAAASLVLVSAVTAGADERANREHVHFCLSPDGSTHETSTVDRIGLDIRLDAGWQFYAEHPGDFGFPPRFDWSISKNVKALTIQWPEPTRYVYSEDPPINTLGYKDAVFLPIQITRGESERPAHVHLTLDYSICNDYCISDRVELQTALPSKEPKRARSRTMPASWSDTRR